MERIFSLLNRTLDKMTQDPEVLLAVTRSDPVLLTAVAARLENYFPDALKIRLLLPGVSEIDEKSLPRMGYADLDMVRETFTRDQPPKIQGYEGADRHLAITARIMQNDRVVGVILTSLNYDFFNKSLQAAAVKNGTIELRQEKRVLAASGEPIDTGQSESVQTKVANTDWDTALVKFKRMLDYSEGPAKYDISDQPPEYDVKEHFIKEK